jgi:transposase
LSHEKRVYTSELIAAQWQVIKPSEQAGFQALPRRQVVERTFAWLGRIAA